MLLKRLSRIDIASLRAAAKELIDSSSIEGVYIAADEQAIQGDFFDEQDVTAVIRVDSRGYSPFCSKCSSSPCLHMAALILCCLDSKDTFEKVDAINCNGLSSSGFTKFESAGKLKKARPLIKKFGRILDGLLLAEELLREVLKLQSSGDKAGLLNSVKGQLEKLDEFHLGGLRFDFLDLLQNQSFQKPEVGFLTQVNQLFEVIKQSKIEFNRVLEEELCVMPYSVLTAKCGHVWKYEELAQLVEPRSTELIQLSFSVIENLTVQRLEENGLWLDLGNGEIYLLQNLRPFKALRYIPESNTEFDLLSCSELVEYPGDYNSRIRLATVTKEKIGEGALKRAYEFAKDFNSLEFNKIKASLRDGLSGMSPHGFFKVDGFGFGLNGVSALLGGFELRLSESFETDVLKVCSKQDLSNRACLFRFDLVEGEVELSPLCLVGESSILRLGF